MDSVEQIDRFLVELRKLDLPFIRELSMDNKNVASICYLQALQNIESSQKISELKQTYSTLNQEYSHQLGIRGDGNCFYRAIMLMNIFLIASNDDPTYLESFIQRISNLKDIKLDSIGITSCANTEDLKLIFLVFLMKIQVWKKEEIKVNISMIINEYNSLVEVDLAAYTIARFLIYQSFMKYSDHPAIKAFVDDEVKSNIPKILLKQNEYAEGIIIPLAAQAFQCQLVIQNVHLQEGSTSPRVYSDKMIYKPLIEDNNTSSPKQIHLLFTKDHYDAFILNEQCDTYPHFYRLPSTKFIFSPQSTNIYSNFLLHQKFKLLKISSSSQIYKSTNSTSPSSSSASSSSSSFSSKQKPDNLYHSKMIPNLLSEETPTQNPENDDDLLIKFDDEEAHTLPTISSKPFFYNKSQSLNETQQNNLSTKNQKCQINVEKCVACAKKIFGFTEHYEIKRISSNSIEKLCKSCNQQLQKSAQSDGKVTLMIKQQIYEILKANNNNQNINANNFTSSNKEVDIPFMNSAFMVNNFSQMDSNKKQIFLDKNKNHTYKKSQTVPLIFVDSEDEKDEDENLIIQMDDDENEVDTINNNQYPQRIDITKCIKCKQGFKSTKYILKGKQIALLCSDCLEGMMADLKKDQQQIQIQNQTFTFGDSILARIKEQQFLNNQIKRQTANSLPQITNNNVQQSKITNTQVFNNQNMNGNNNNNRNMAMQPCLQKCMLCNKMEQPTYEVIQIIKSGKEEPQRVCKECLHLFILYYQYPSSLVKFGGNTFKVTDLFGKYLYNQQLTQLQPQAHIQDTKCIICKGNCPERFPLTLNDSSNSISSYIGHNCFYFNLSCIQDRQYFVYDNKTYLMDKSLQILANQHLAVQANLMQKYAITS